MLDLDLEFTALFLDRNARPGVGIRKVDDELVSLAFTFGDGLGSEKVLAAIVSTGIVEGFGFGSGELLLEAADR